MLEAISIARSLLALGEAGTAIVKTIIRTVQGQDERTKREALDAALAAAETVAAKAMFRGRA